MPERMVSFAAGLGELDIRPGDRVLIMLPDGPGFTEALTVTTQRGALPLPVNPELPAHQIAAVVAEADAQVILLIVDRVGTLADLGAEPPVWVEGPQGPWAAALRLR
jgi:acyl-CoA synthetase (AMP-forming)/AMP-acid ligase II